MPHPLVFALLTVMTLSPAAAGASHEPLSVQVAALGDAREAAVLSARLRQLGFDAYTEMGAEMGAEVGVLTRVRVGCFLDRGSAERLVTALQPYTQEAVIVPLMVGASPRVCVAQSLGFRLPPRWGVAARAAHAVVFWVELGGRRGFVGFDGERWTPLQTEALGTAQRWLDGYPTGPDSTPFGSREVLVVHHPEGESALVVATGTLVWQTDGVAVIRDDGALVAVSITPSESPR